MKIPAEQTKLEFFSGLYEDAKNKSHSEDYARQMAQYKGDNAIDGSSERATATRNITYELIEAKVSNDIPSPKVTPSSYNEQRHRCSRSAERFLVRERDRLDYEAINDLDERYTYIFGGAYYLAEWDDTAGDVAEHGAIRLRLLSPEDVIPQPNVYRIEDMDYIFVRYNTTRQAIEDRYGVTIPEEEGDQDTERTEHPDDKDTVTVIVCYYKRDGRVCKYSWSGETEIEDQDDFYARRNRKCKLCGKYDTQCACEKPAFETVPLDYEELDEDIIRPDGSVIPALSPEVDENGDVVMQTVKRIVRDPDTGETITDPKTGLPMTYDAEEPKMVKTKIPFYKPTLFPIVARKNTSADRSLLGKSDCDTIRPQQQAINKVESRIMQKLMRASVTPIVPEDAQISVNNSVFGQVIRLRPGESVAQYGKVDTTPDISADTMEAERLYQQAKMIVGITDSYQGVSEYAGQSGKAMQTLALQSAGRIESTRRMKRFAYSQLDAVMFQLALAFSDEPRNLRYTDAYGIEQNTQFSRYDFLEQNPDTGAWEYYDGFTFSADASAAMEQDRQTMWETNLQNYQQGAFGMVGDPATLLRYWKMQERDHYPHASEQVAYFQQMLAQQQAAVQPQRPIQGV